METFQLPGRLESSGTVRRFCFGISPLDPVFPVLVPKKGFSTVYHYQQPLVFVDKSDSTHKFYSPERDLAFDFHFYPHSVWSYATVIALVRRAPLAKSVPHAVAHADYLDRILDAIHIARSHDEAIQYAISYLKLTSATFVHHNHEHSGREHYYYAEFERIVCKNNKVSSIFGLRDRNFNPVGQIRDQPAKIVKTLRIVPAHFLEMPLAPAQSVFEEPPFGDTDDHVPFGGGDGRLLRDSASGQFGSYPSFEGDDEPE